MSAFDTTDRRELVPLRRGGHLVFALVATGFAVLTLGCDDGSAERILMRKACLQHLFDVYAAYSEADPIGPTDVSSLASFLDENPDLVESKLIGEQVVTEEMLKRVTEGEIVVIWGGRFPESADERSGCLVAFEARTPGSGGYIVPADGIVKHVTAKEFGEFDELPQ